jgi:tRNA U34 2-thiouridine synthase MnmA/TrmU
MMHDFDWLSDSLIASSGASHDIPALAQFRHRMEPAPCTVSLPRNNKSGHPVVITFDEPQYAVAPGQVAAVYIGDQCLGCGVIQSSSRDGLKY